jgi:RNase P subunit RPR2
MPRSKKIDLEKVLACLDTVCPKCGKTITPAKVQRIRLHEDQVPRVRREVRPE